MLEERPSVRTPDATEQLEPFDVVFFTTGPAGAHQIRNDTDSGGERAEPVPGGGAGGLVRAHAICPLGYLLYRRGAIRSASAALALYSLSGLVGLGHYTATGITEAFWLRQAHVIADVRRRGRARLPRGGDERGHRRWRDGRSGPKAVRAIHPGVWERVFGGTRRAEFGFAKSG